MRIEAVYRGEADTMARVVRIALQVLHHGIREGGVGAVEYEDIQTWHLKGKTIPLIDR
jgi:hypothetical protein